MYYEINVSKDGQHLFATHERSVTNTWKLKALIDIFQEKFPESEGYKLKIVEWESKGKIFSIDDIKTVF